MIRLLVLLFVPLLVMSLTPDGMLMQNAVPPTQMSDAVEVWLTLPDQSRLLHRETDLTFQTADPSANVRATITVDPSVQYQVMEGFGAAMTDSSAWNLMRVMSSRQRDQVMRDLFTREGDGIGLSYVRIPIGASDFSVVDQTYDDMPRGETDPNLEHFSINYDEAYIIPALRMAMELNPQLRFMGSPWSAPGWMKNTGRLHGGTLLPEHYQAYANYLVRWIQAYGEQGVPVDTLTPQNEPMHSNDGYPTMLIPPEGQAELVRDHLGPAMRAANLDTRLVIFDHNWDLYTYPLTVLSDPEAAVFVDGVAFHCYGGDVRLQSNVHNAYPDKPIWFTECSGGGWAVGFANNLSWNIRTLVIGNFRHWGNSVMLWNLALDQTDGPQNGGCGNCRGVVTINSETGAITYNEEYYILGHVSRFVDPGAHRIDSTEFFWGQPENVAFQNPDGSIVLLVHSVVDTTFAVNWQGQHIEYSLPGGAVVTFKWNASR